MVRLIIISLGILAFPICQIIHASEFKSEHKKVRQLTEIAALYAKEHQGRPPSSLEDIKDYLDLRELLKSDSSELGPFTERYAFPSSELIVSGKGRLLVVGTAPIFGTNLPEPSQGGRYLGYITAQGGTDASWMHEAEVLKLLAAANVKLKPIGGVVPAPTWAGKIRQDAMTDYQKRVTEAAKKGEIPIQPRSDDENPPKMRSTTPSAPTIATESGPNWLLIMGAAAAALLGASGLIWFKRKNNPAQK